MSSAAARLICMNAVKQKPFRDVCCACLEKNNGGQKKKSYHNILFFAVVVLTSVHLKKKTLQELKSTKNFGSSANWISASNY